MGISQAARLASIIRLMAQSPGRRLAANFIVTVGESAAYLAFTPKTVSNLTCTSATFVISATGTTMSEPSLDSDKVCTMLLHQDVLTVGRFATRDLRNCSSPNRQSRRTP